MITTQIISSFSGVWQAGVMMILLGSAFALVLLIASEKLKVEVDPKIEQIHAALPNIDCGACGFAGCSSYAKAVAEKPDLIGKCAPGGDEVSQLIAAVLNLQVSGGGAPTRPIIHCRAHTDDRTILAEYHGIPTCTSANAYGSSQACKFGCLGFGDCIKACKFNALHIIDGLSTVDYEKCTGCTACSKACPRNLIEMVPFTHENMMVVACRSTETGKVTRSMCKVGCIGCGICVKQTDLFEVTDNNAQMNYEKYQPNEQTQTAMTKCPTKVIILAGKNAPPPTPAKQPKPKPAKATA